jgi:hypothetical protein
MNYNKEFFLKGVMYSAVVLMLICTIFLSLQIRKNNDFSLLPFMGFGIDFGVLIISFCSSYVFWYLRKKWDGQGLLPDPVKNVDQSPDQICSYGELVEKEKPCNNDFYLKLVMWIGLAIAVCSAFLLLYVTENRLSPIAASSLINFEIYMGVPIITFSSIIFYCFLGMKWSGVGQG